MGSVKVGEDVAPGWIAIWRLWRHCLCRFGWYPLLVAPLVTCACLLDLYSSTGCDFVRLDVGFQPANDVWGASHAQLGLFSFDSHRVDRNKWKRSFNNGCQLYSENFESSFIASDQTWHVARIMAYISGISSLVALSTAWLLTITPLPASFFWPGVLLPAVVLSMLTGAAKFIFFDTQICTEPLWFETESSEAVPAKSCEIGESSVFGIASVAAYFFCTVLICFRSPQKRVLDDNWGKPVVEVPGSTVTGHTGTDIVVNDPERGHALRQSLGNSTADTVQVPNASGNRGMRRGDSVLQDSQQTMKHKNGTPQIIEHGPQHTRTTSDVTWSTGSNVPGSNKNVQPLYNEQSRNVGALNPPPTGVLEENKRPQSADEWNDNGRPIVVTINDNGQGESRSLSYSDGSSAQSSSKSPGRNLPPRHNRRSTIHQQSPGNNGINNNNRGDDAASVRSQISKISFAETQHSDDLSALGMHSISRQSRQSQGSQSAKSAPKVVNIPRAPPRHGRHTFSGASASTHSSGKRSRYSKRSAREDRNDVFLNEQNHQSNGGNHGRMMADAKREVLEYLPRLDEMSATRSLEDHGDLINNCLRDLEMSFEDGNGHFRTM